tara:strand:+ start:1045 stop:1308 length:264 start_codon:yes stop_codon:yes gene_type:complete
MASAWLEFLAKFRKSHPDLKGKEVMKQAAVEYKKKKPATKEPKKGKKEPKAKKEPKMAKEPKAKKKGKIGKVVDIPKGKHAKVVIEK